MPNLTHPSDPNPNPSTKPAELMSPVAPDGTAWTWRFRSDFAPWLRELRARHGLTLKVIAARAGITHTRLHKLETGGRVRAPSLALLARLAEIYGCDTDELLSRAGYRVELPQDLRDALRCDEAFAAVVMHPSLRPTAMDERWLESYSRMQKAQWVEFARKLEAHVREGGPAVSEILDESRGANDHATARPAARAG